MLLIKGGQILLIKRSDTLSEFPGWYMLPGGKQEKNETSKEAAFRETLEETGFLVKDASLRIIATHYHEYKSKVYQVYIFVADNFSGSIKKSREGIPVWLDIDQALDDPKLYPDLKRHIKLIINSKDGELFFTYHRFNKDLKIIESR